MDKKQQEWRFQQEESSEWAPTRHTAKIYNLRRYYLHLYQSLLLKRTPLSIPAPWHHLFSHSYNKVAPPKVSKATQKHNKNLQTWEQNSLSFSLSVDWLTEFATGHRNSKPATIAKARAAVRGGRAASASSRRSKSNHVASSAKRASKKQKRANREWRPKRALGPYMFFCKDQHANVTADNPNIPFTEVGRILGAQWTQMTEKDKKVGSECAHSLCNSRFLLFVFWNGPWSHFIHECSMCFCNTVYFYTWLFHQSGLIQEILFCWGVCSFVESFDGGNVVDLFTFGVLEVQE